MKHTIYLLIVLLAFSCVKKDKNTLQESSNILDKVILTHGVQSYTTHKIFFSIDDTKYSMSYPNGRARYTMVRTYQSVRNKVVYDGGYLTYYKNDTLQPDGSFPYQIIERQLYGLLHSVSIPKDLTANDFTIKILDDVIIRSKPYYALEATSPNLELEKTNRIILYISKQDFIIEYYALDYNAIALQKQFRRLINARKINDILFQDISIFVSNDSILPLDKYYTHYNNPKLVPTKKIELKNIEVIPLKN